MKLVSAHVSVSIHFIVCTEPKVMQPMVHEEYAYHYCPVWSLYEERVVTLSSDTLKPPTLPITLTRITG